MKPLPWSPLALALLCVFCLALPAAAAKGEFMTLLGSAGEPAGAPADGLPPAAERLAAVRLDGAVLAADPDRISIPLPDGRFLVAFRTKSRLEGDTFSWAGELQQEAAAEAPRFPGSVAFYRNGGRIFGTLRTQDGAYYELQPENGNHRLVRLAPSAGDSCGVGHGTRGDSGDAAEKAGVIFAGSEADCTTPGGADKDITVLVLYPRSLAGSAAAVNTYSSDQISVSNTLFDDSDVKISYRQVPSSGTAIMITGEQPPPPIPTGGKLDPLATGPVIEWLNDQFESDGVDTEVEILRNYYGADLVVVVIPFFTSGNNVNCGVANLPKVVSGVEKLSGSNENFDAQAFAVVELGCDNSDYTFAHELGHTFGMRHETDASGETPVYPWAYGHKLCQVVGGVPTNVAATVMGCFEGSGPGACDRIGQFSHPDLPYVFNSVSTETGVHSAEVGQTCKPRAAHNACVANLRATQYENFESAPPTTPPTLTITSPTDGSSQSSTSLTLTATASDAQDGNRAAYVQWKSDRQGSLGTGSPLSVTLTHYGWHLITATVSDTSGTKITKSVRLKVTETTAPQRYIDYPAHNEQVGGNYPLGKYTVVGWAIDQSGVNPNGFSFQVDGQPVTLENFTYGTHRSDVCAAYPSLNDPNCPYVGFQGVLDTRDMANGTHSLSMTVTDIHGNSGSASRTFRTQNSRTAYLNPVEDSWVSENQPNTNFGSDTQLSLRASGSGLAKHAYLKFELAGAARPIATAKLEVRTGSSAWDVINIYRLATTSWTENGITWNNAPLDPLGYLQFGSQPANTFVLWDIGSLLAGSGNGYFTFGLVTSDTAGHFMYSSEDSSRQPTLILTY